MGEEEFPEPTELERRFSRLLRAIRIITGVDQKNLAASVDISLEHYHGFENGEKTVSVGMVMVFCEEMNINYLLVFEIVELENKQKNNYITDAICELANDTNSIITKELKKTLNSVLEQFVKQRNQLN